MRAAVALLVLIAAPAAAQQAQPSAEAQRSPLPPGVGTAAELQEREETGRVREAVRTSDATVRERRIFTQRFARCAVDRRRESAMAMVDEMIPSTEIPERFRFLLNGSCFPRGTPLDDNFVTQAQFPFPTLHVALADALVRELYSQPGPGDFAAIPPQVRLTRTNAAVTSQPADAAVDGAPLSAETATWWYVLERFGECVARRMPEPVRLMARTDVSSPEERAVIQSLQPVFGACLPAGATLRLRPADVRGSSLLAYYRMARAAAAAPQGTP